MHDQQDTECPDWLRQVLDSGRKAGRALLAVDELVGQDAFYVERSLMGLVRVESSSCNGIALKASLRLLPGYAWDGMDHATLHYPLESVSADQWSLSMNAGYGANSTLVFHPAVIGHFVDIATQPEWMRQVLRLVRDEESWPVTLTGAVASTSGPWPTQPKNTPSCRVRQGGGRFIVELRDLPVQEGRCLVWAVDNPLIAVLAVCQVCLSLDPQLMQRLVQYDRAHRLAHPGAIPAVAADAEELFAGRPELALLYHQRFGGVSINGNLSDSDAIRMLRAVGECCGIRMLSPQRVSARAVAEGRSARNLRTAVAPDGDAHMVSVKRVLHS